MIYDFSGKISIDTSGALKNVNAIDNKLNSFASSASGLFNKIGNAATSLGKTLTAGLTAPITALGIASTKTFMDFQQSIANAASVCGAMGQELKNMENLARKMGATSVFSASEAADAMYFMASAGWGVTDMQNALNSTLELAAATQFGLAETTDAVISSLNQFRLTSADTGRVTNVFASACANSQATMEKLAYSMRYVGPVANSLGMEIEETTASLMGLYQAGFKGEQAGTILRGGLTKLMKPTKEARKALSELGLSVADVNPAAHDLSLILDKLSSAGMDTAQAIRVFGQVSGPGMMALIAQGGSALEDYEDKITGTQKAAEMAAMQIDTLKGSFKLLKSALEEAALSIANLLAPAMNGFVKDTLIPTVTAFNTLTDSAQLTVVKIAGFAAALGPTLLIGGKLVSILGSVAGVVAGIAGPIGIVIAGVGAITAVCYSMGVTFKDVASGIQQAVAVVASQINNVIAFITSFAMQNKGLIDNIIGTIFALLQSVVSASQALLKMQQSILAFLTGDIGQFLNWLLAIVGDALNMVTEIFSLFANILNGNWDAAWQNIKNILYDAVQILIKLVIGLSQILTNIITNLGTIISKIFEWTWEAIKIGLKAFCDWAIEAIIGFGDWILDGISTICDNMVFAWQNGWDKMQWTMQEKINGMLDMYNKFVGAIGLEGMQTDFKVNWQEEDPYKIAADRKAQKDSLKTKKSNKEFSFKNGKIDYGYRSRSYLKEGQNSPTSKLTEGLKSLTNSLADLPKNINKGVDNFFSKNQDENKIANLGLDTANAKIPIVAADFDDMDDFTGSNSALDTSSGGAAGKYIDYKRSNGTGVNNSLGQSSSSLAASSSASTTVGTSSSPEVKIEKIEIIVQCNQKMDESEIHKIGQKVENEIVKRLRNGDRSKGLVKV